MKKQYRGAVAIVGFVLLFSGCAFLPVDQGPPKNSEKVSVVTSFYPVAYMVEKVGGEFVDVDVLVQPGVEPHEYEPTTQDGLAVATAELVVYSGLGLDNWIQDVAMHVSGQPDMLVLSEPNDSWVRTLSESGSIAYDPHTWLSILIVEQQATRIAQKLSEIDPLHAEAYTAHATEFITELTQVHAELASTIGNSSVCPLRTFVSSHNAFGYFAHEYHLTMIAVNGISPEEEPSAATIAQVIETIRSEHVPVVFFETLASPDIAQTIANETGATTDVLNPIEGLTAEEAAAGKEYIDVMRDNANALMKALQCK